MNLKLISLASITAVSSVFAGGLALSDTDFTFNINGVPLAPGVYEARFGTVTSGVFTPYFGTEVNANSSGYFDMGVATREIQGGVNTSNNSVVNIGTQVAYSMSTLPDDSSYATVGASNSVVITDPSWIVSLFTFTSEDQSFVLTSNTSVLLLSGQNPATSIAFNNGNEIINLVTVPEPSTYAVVAGIAVLGLASIRRRRVA